MEYIKKITKKIIANYKLGILHGEYKEYKNNKINIIANYDNGELAGDYKTYYTNGNVAASLCLLCLAGVCLAKGNNTQLTIGTMGFVVAQIGINIVINLG